MSSGCQVKNPGEEHAFVSKRDYENSLGSVACECGGAVDVLEDTSLLLVEDACGKVSFGSQLNACMGTVSLPCRLMLICFSSIYPYRHFQC